MITVVIKDSGEDKVTQLTYENLWRELKDIPESEILILKNWSDGLEGIVNKYICFVEADCLVNSGYFTSQLGLLRKDPYLRKLAMLSATTGVNNWANRFYGYEIDTEHDNKVTPILHKRSGVVDAVQIGYFPGSIVRVNMLKKELKILQDFDKHTEQDLVTLSTKLSLAFWRRGDGNRVHINPNAVYVTTEDYVNDLGRFPAKADDLLEKFGRESI